MVSSVEDVVSTGQPWAFTERHAELGYAQYFDSLEDLNKVEWEVMPLKYWAGSEDAKEKRQAEFLVHDWFPWTAVLEIVARVPQTAKRIEELLESESHKPPVSVKPAWYY